MMSVCLLLFIIIMIFLLSLLFMPVNYNFGLLYDEEIHGIISINLGLFYFSLKNKPSLLKVNFFGINLYSGVPPHKKPNITSEEDKGKDKDSSKKSNTSFDIKPYLSKAFLKCTLDLLIDLIELVKPIKAKISGCIGLPEPHETALLIAAIAAIEPLVASIEIDLMPLWNDEYFELEMQVIGKFIPAIIFFKLIKYLFRREIRTIWTKLLQNRINKPKVQPTVSFRGI